MKVNKIKKLNSGKYKIEFDNKQRLITYDDVILKNNLLFEKTVDAKKLNNLVKDNEYYNIYNKCINYISIKMRSQKEIEKYISKYKADDYQEKIITELKNRGLINDSMFLKSYIADRINLSNVGPNKIRQELLEHNIDLKEINIELENIDHSIIEDKLLKIVSKKIKNNKYSINYLKQEIINDLTKDGFYKEDILNALNNFNIEDKEALKKEYDKQYHLLSKKYSGKELEYKIKQKLCQKGFNINDNLLD